MLKCVCILTVVYIHSISASFHLQSFSGNLARDLTRFAVPGLLFAAGFLFDKKKDTTGQILKKKLVRLLPPYLFCSLCIQFLDLPGLFVSLENLDARQLIFNLFFGSTLGIYYFVFVLLYLYIFSLVLRKIPDKWILVIWGISICLTLVFAIKVFTPDYPFFRYVRHPFVHSLPYLTGWIFFLYYEAISEFVKKNVRVIVFTCIILDVIILAYSRMDGGCLISFPTLTQFQIYISIALLLIIGMTTMKLQKGIQFVSDCSYGIYLLHFPIVRACQLVFPEGFQNYSFMFAFLAWCAGTAGSILLIYGVRKLSGQNSRYLVGC